MNQGRLFNIQPRSIKRHKLHGMFTSDRQSWSTPDDLFNQYDREFGFTIDVAASDDNAKCDRYFTKQDNGLRQDWSGDICWMNPPYNEAYKWMRKAYSESLNGATVVCLMPSRTGTAWFHDFVLAEYTADEVRFLRGRLKFGDGSSNAPFDSVIIIYRSDK